MELINERLTGVELRLTRLEDSLQRVLNHVAGIYEMLEALGRRIEERFIKIERWQVNTDLRLDGLDKSVKGVQDQLIIIQTEIIKIGTATRYEQYHIDQKKFDLKN